jgi:signal transduction histidine kinase
MNTEAQLKVFDRYFRVNTFKAKAFPGLGLGLFISSEIIKRHKGIIGVRSQENKGSEFYFVLPFKCSVN